MKKNKITIGILACIGIFFIAAIVIVPAAQAAEKTVKYNCTSQITKAEFVVLPDMKGHITGVFERRGVAIFENEVAALKIWGTFEKKKGRTSYLGYLQITFKDGSTILQKTSGSHAPPPGEKLDVYEGKGEYINGTGRFEGRDLPVRSAEPVEGRGVGERQDPAVLVHESEVFAGAQRRRKSSGTEGGDLEFGRGR